VTPTSRNWALVVTLALGCSWLQFAQPPPKVERLIPIPFGEPGRMDLISMRGAWLRAAEMVSAAYFGNLEPLSDPSPLEACLRRRESYDVEVWAQQDVADGGQRDEDAGQSDAGKAFDAPVPRVLFVSIFLHWDACDLGESPPTDIGGEYAVDTSTWQVVGWRP